MERLACNQDDLEQYDIDESELFWNSKNYEEYAVACDLRNLPCHWTKEEFESIHSFGWMVETKEELHAICP